MSDQFNTNLFKILSNNRQYNSDFLFHQLSSLPPLNVSPLQQAFKRLKTNLELQLTLDENVQQHHNALRGIIEQSKNLEKTLLIGSLGRKTGIQPRENDVLDIDILVVMDYFVCWTNNGGISAQIAMEEMNQIISKSDRYDSMNPINDQPTVCFTYKGDGTKVEVVPAYLDKIGHSANGRYHSPIERAYWVPKSGKWELADYEYEADFISKKNQTCDELLIPLIKMLKAIKRIYFPSMNSFFLEIMAVNIIPSSLTVRKLLKLPISYPMLLLDFFKQGRFLLNKPQQIPGSLSTPITLDISSVINIAKIFIEITSYLNNINRIPKEIDQLKHWKVLFGDPFTLS